MSQNIYQLFDKVDEQTDDEIINLAEQSRTVNIQTLESKFDDKVRHISSMKKLYDIKVGEKEVEIDDEEIGLQVEI